MKAHVLILTIAAVLSLSACKEKSAVEKAQDKVGDALNNRPGEKQRDAAEEIKDAAKKSGEAIEDAAAEVKDAVTEAAKEVKDAAVDAKDSVKDATK